MTNDDDSMTDDPELAVPVTTEIIAGVVSALETARLRLGSLSIPDVQEIWGKEDMDAFLGALRGLEELDRRFRRDRDRRLQVKRGVRPT